jgi:hypothetical protein
MKRYYFVNGVTLYDGLEFGFNYVCERTKKLTQELAEKDVEQYQIHQDSGEELDMVDFQEITKKDYDIFIKFQTTYIFIKKEIWYEVFENQGKKLGTKTLISCNTLEEAKEKKAKLLKANSELKNKLHIDMWTIKNGFPQPIQEF